MSNMIKKEMYKIEIPKELSERSKMGVSKAKKEMQIGRKRYNAAGIIVVAGLLLSVGTFAFFHNSVSPMGKTNNQNSIIITNSGGVKIPAMQLPEGHSNADADTVGLIVYNGKIYTQANTEIDAENAKTIMGEKLGKTKGNIDEWSKQDAYAEEFASTIGIEDVYSVKGYDKGFRIMTFGKREGKFYANFYENFNGITINSGEDVFGKLKMAGNVFSAEYRTFSDWDNNVEHYNPIVDMKALNIFVEELNKAKPFPRGGDSEPISISKNNESLREVAIHLKDGTKVKLILLKDGYIYYGNIGAYFKMNEDIFSRLWSQLK
jgi:hypothetical protein